MPFSHSTEATGQEIESTYYISRFRYKGRRGVKNNPHVWVNIFPLLGGDFTQGIAGCPPRAFLNNYSSFKLMTYIPAPFCGALACILIKIHGRVLPFSRGGLPLESGTEKKRSLQFDKGRRLNLHVGNGICFYQGKNRSGGSRDISSSTWSKEQNGSVTARTFRLAPGARR